VVTVVSGRLATALAAAGTPRNPPLVTRHSVKEAGGQRVVAVHAAISPP